VTDEHALSRAAGDGVRAQSLLENEMLKGAFKALEDSYMAAWRATTIDEVGSREKLFIAINIVAKVRDHLTAVVNNGKLAEAELKHLVETAERKKKFGII
jgi:hypothetical protein